ncbi:hypothetical protein [Streptomyces sanyensis]|uniref:hypothetical protein n=1 Tax=Streptomyces TaxID=1883 RepID=UPI0031E656CF
MEAVQVLNVAKDLGILSGVYLSATLLVWIVAGASAALWMLMLLPALVAGRLLLHHRGALAAAARERRGR